MFIVLLHMCSPCPLWNSISRPTGPTSTPLRRHFLASAGGA
jgi:hypothetical protein